VKHNKKNLNPLTPQQPVLKESIHPASINPLTSQQPVRKESIHPASINLSYSERPANKELIIYLNSTDYNELNQNDMNEPDMNEPDLIGGYITMHSFYYKKYKQDYLQLSKIQNNLLLIEHEISG
jgi:hypothetical protein